MEKEKLIKNILFFILFGITGYACQHSKSHFIKIKKYPTGEVFSKTSFSAIDSLKDGVHQEFYKKGSLKKVIHFKTGVPIDSAMQYYDTGKLEFKEVRTSDTLYVYYYFKNGNLNLKKKFLNREKPIEIGWSVFFNNDGSVADSVEHILIADSSYNNQQIKFSTRGEIIRDSSNYFRFKLDSIPNSSLFELRIIYDPKIPGSDVFFILGDGLNDEFSNTKKVILDTILMKDNYISSSTFEKSSRTFKGFFYEHRIERYEDNGQDSVKLSILENRAYFNIFLETKK